MSPALDEDEGKTVAAEEDDATLWLAWTMRVYSEEVARDTTSPCFDGVSSASDYPVTDSARHIPCLLLSLSVIGRIPRRGRWPVIRADQDLLSMGTTSINVTRHGTGWGLELAFHFLAYHRHNLALTPLFNLSSGLDFLQDTGKRGYMKILVKNSVTVANRGK